MSTTRVRTTRASHALVALLMMALLAAFTPTRAAATTERSTAEARAEAVFVDLYNQARANPAAWYDGATEAPQPALEAWTDIRAVARDWSDAMAAANQLSHNPSFGDQLCCWRRAGENVGVIGGVDGLEDVDQAVDRLVRAFMASDGHRANMTDAGFTQMGIGVTISDNGKLWVTINFRELASGATVPASRYDQPTASGPEPSARSIDDTCGDRGAARFSDVAGNVHETAINCVADRGISQGKGDGRYVPAATLRRGQIATFLVRTLDAAGRPAPAESEDAFTDDNGTAHEASFNRLAALGVFTGDRARPNDAVTRGEMAALVVATLRGAGITTGAAGADYFSDDDGSEYEDAINIVAELGIATGKRADTFAPDATLSRAQMATFLARTLDLALNS